MKCCSKNLNEMEDDVGITGSGFGFLISKINTKKNIKTELAPNECEKQNKRLKRLV